MIWLVFAAFTALALPAAAHEAVYAATVRSVYDGDTLRADIALGLDLVLLNQPLRLDGIDTPERGHRAGCDDERALADLARARLVELTTGTVTVELRDRDKYGRWLAGVTADGIDVAGVMVAEGLARPYAGGAREGWC